MLNLSMHPYTLIIWSVHYFVKFKNKSYDGKIKKNSVFASYKAYLLIQSIKSADFPSSPVVCM